MTKDQGMSGGRLFQNIWRDTRQAVTVIVVTADAPIVTCQECEGPVPPDVLRLELTCDDEWFAYCEECWQREVRRSVR
jgi:hypothetical protein